MPDVLSQMNADQMRQEIHVWQCRLDYPSASLQKYFPALSADERTRAERFHFEKHRTRFIAGRAFMRTILARYLQIDPSQIAFQYSHYGKPSLANANRRNELFFSLTHSHQLALLAVTYEAEVGIDIEHLRNVSDGLADGYFSPSEIAALRNLPERLQREAFFTCWTRKEAYIKALGGGLSVPLDTFDVSLAPGAPAMILNIRCGGESPSAWRLEHLTPAEDYVGAVAIRAQNCKLKLWQADEF